MALSAKPLENGVSAWGSAGARNFLGLLPILGFALLGALAIYAIGSARTVSEAIILLLAPFLLLIVSIGFSQGFTRAVAIGGTLKWWHGLWFLAFCSGLIWRSVGGLNDTPQDPVDTTAAIRIVLEVLLGISLLLLLASRRQSWIASMFRGLPGGLTCLGLIFLVSTAWSVLPLWTFLRSGEFLLDVALLAVVLVAIPSLKGYEEFLEWTWSIYGCLLAWIWMGIVFFPHDALQRGVGTLGVQLYGIVPWVHANSVGEYGAILGIVALSRLVSNRGGKRDRFWYLGLLFFGLATLLLAQTRSAIAGFGLAMILVLLLSGRRALNIFLFVGGVTLLLVGSVSTVALEFLQRGQDIHVVQQLTGRTQYWAIAWHKLLERPWTGYGAFAGGRFVVLTYFPVNHSQMHSDYFEILIGTSFWGVAAIFIVLAAAWYILSRTYRGSPADSLEKILSIEAMGVLAVLTVRSFLNDTLVWHPPLPFLAVLGFAEFVRRRGIRMPGRNPQI
jgi:O-antigen ligase